MEWVLVLRWLHVIGAAVLLGTGAGIAFFMLMAHRTGDAKLIAHTADSVVTADLIFTATAVVMQPVTGFLLANAIGWDVREGWIVISLVLYVVTGLFWLPVVVIQMRLREIAKEAAMAGQVLPQRYHDLFRIWFACGFPAFFAVLTIFWLMVARPEISF